MYTEVVCHTNDFKLFGRAVLAQVIYQVLHWLAETSDTDDHDKGECIMCVLYMKYISLVQPVNGITDMQSVTVAAESPPLSKNITDDEKICLPSSTPRDDSHTLAGSAGTSAYGEAVEGVLPTSSPYSKILW